MTALREVGYKQDKTSRGRKRVKDSFTNSYASVPNWNAAGSEYMFTVNIPKSLSYYSMFG